MATPLIGIGTDVHAFDPAQPCWVAGLRWDGVAGLAGHSDGDVVAHAACDALFSAAGLGDLGSNFGTGRQEWAGASGVSLLAEAARRVRAAGFEIGNVATQVIGERPKVGLRRAEAEQLLGDAIGGQFRVSGTTTDGLGLTGRGEGLAAVAVALLFQHDQLFTVRLGLNASAVVVRSLPSALDSILVSMRVPLLLAGLVDDAAALPPCGRVLSEALAQHRSHRTAWYADLIGPLLLPASRLSHALALAEREAEAEAAASEAGAGGRLAVGIVGDAGPAPDGLPQISAAITAAIASARNRVLLSHIEVAVAMRGDDPLPGLRSVLALDRVVNRGCSAGDGVGLYAEIPLTWGVLASLDRLAEARAEGAVVAPKFRTGGLASELFPTPVELAAVICACRDRDLPFRLTSGLQRAIRRTDPDTGLVNHGFVNVLAAVVAAVSGAEPADLAELLAGTESQPLVEAVRGQLDAPRPLWRGFGGCGRVAGPLADLRALGLLPAPSLPTA